VGRRATESIAALLKSREALDARLAAEASSYRDSVWASLVDVGSPPGDDSRLRPLARRMTRVWGSENRKQLQQSQTSEGADLPAGERNERQRNAEAVLREGVYQDIEFAPLHEAVYVSRVLGTLPQLVNHYTETRRVRTALQQESPRNHCPVRRAD
jgi:hypothetical protein